MLNLNNLRLLLSQVVSAGGIHTATLLTPEGHLVSFASDPPRSKDEVRVMVGLSSEIWQETKEQDVGMADSELGRLVVLPVEQARRSPENEEEEEPLLLLALNANDTVSWDAIEKRARQLVQHLSKPVSDLRGKLTNNVPVSSAQRRTY